MNGVTLTLMILGATLPLAALGLAAGLLTERITGAPSLRERVWGLALLAPVMAVVAVLLVSPHLSRPAPVAPPATDQAAVLAEVAVTAPPVVAPFQTLIDVAWLLAPTILLSLMLLGMIVAVVLLLRRHVQLLRLVRMARPLDDHALSADLQRQAAALKVRAPSLKASDRAGSPLLAGLIRPAIVIPRALTRLPTARLALICGHELAHLKRGDNPRAWAEGLLMAVMWFNPFMAMIQARLNAAREEGCDAMALAQADGPARRAYAESLIETLRLSAGPEPQSAFIGAGSKTAMRLQAILKPHGPAGPRAKAGAIAIAAALALTVGGATVALAMQAAPERAVTGRASSWQQSMQDNALAPKGRIDVAADRMRKKDGIIYWTGRPAVVMTAATGDPRRDAELAGVRFLVNGKPAAADFTPNDLDLDQIGLITIKGPSKGESGPTVINIVMAPEAPPAPPTPPTAPTPMVAPTPPTPPTEVTRLAPLPPLPPTAPTAPAPTPPPAPPAPPAPPMPVVSRPVFEARPTGADVAAVYPHEALNARLSGRVTLFCQLTTAGLLTKCETRGETPAGNGFADAALKLAPKFRVRMPAPDGRPAGNSAIVVPIAFGAPAATPTPRPAPSAR